MIKAILFDFNGVIINDEPLHLQAYAEILKNENIEMTEEDYYSCLGMDDKAYIETAFGRAEQDIDDAKISEIMDAKTARWRELVEENVPLFDGVENFIKKSEKDFALGIVSMARKEEIEHILEKLDLKNSFSIIVSAEDISKHKPDPECYQKGFSLIDRWRMKAGGNPITREDCLVIEDAPQGITAGKNAGLKTLGVTNTVEEKRLREAGADSVTHSLADWMPDTIRRVFT